MNSRFYEFNMDLTSYHDLEQPGNSSPCFRKADDPTCGGGDLHQAQDFFYQKPSRNLAVGYEISFENGFMKEHQAAFETALQNFMESFGTPSKAPANRLSLQSFPGSNCYRSIQELVRSPALASSAARTENFLDKLMEYDKLEEFLDIVVSQTEGFLVLQLAQLAEKLLQEYENAKSTDPSSSELLSLANRIASTANLDSFTSLGEASPQQSEVAREAAERLCQVFCGTVMLVTGQFFVNPYFEQESGALKRPLTPWSLQESEEDFEPLLAKKRKFSF